MIVGVTGGIGSGKTTVTQFFDKFEDVVVYIADQEAKNIMNSSIVIKEKIITAFGEQSYLNNKLNKPYIANIVFSQKNKLALLNTIVHPEVRKHFIDFVQLHKSKSYIVYENAILFESKSNQLCNTIISVFVPLQERILRVTLRDNIAKKEVIKRIENQWLEEKKLLQSNYIIYNTSLEFTQIQVNHIHNILKKKKNLI